MQGKSYHLTITQEQYSEMSKLAVRRIKNADWSLIRDCEIFDTRLKSRYRSISA